MPPPLPSQPGPVLQSINKLLHIPPFSFIFYGLFWSFVLVVASPFAGVFLLVLTALRCVVYAILLPFGVAGGKRIKPRQLEGEYAVIITGCDSGFGRDLAVELSRKGFVVFAGCLSQDAMGQFEGLDGAVPLKMDVTKQEEVDAASGSVRKWIAEGKPGSVRVLHALVNNAGVGTGGLIDWIGIQEYRRDMEVNYFGMVRVVKAFMPVIKSQLNTASHSRIINMVSAAGLLAAGNASPYIGSKFAAEAFSSCLRHELRAFGVSVVTVNPTMHQTPLADGLADQVRKKWQGLSPGLKEEYGEDFFEQYFVNVVHMAKRATWEAATVTDELVWCVELENPPAQCVVGADGKYGLLVMRHLPVWLQDLVLSSGLSSTTKPALVEKGK